MSNLFSLVKQVYMQLSAGERRVAGCQQVARCIIKKGPCYCNSVCPELVAKLFPLVTSLSFSSPQVL